MNSYQHSLFEVSLVLFKLNIAIKFPCKVNVSLKRGHKRYSLPQAYPLDPDKFKCDFGGAAVVYQTVYSKEKNGAYLPEKTLTSISLVTEKGTKTAGHFEINPAALIGVPNGDATVVSPLEKCPDTKAMISYSVRVKKVKDLTEEEYR